MYPLRIDGLKGIEKPTDLVATGWLRYFSVHVQTCQHTTDRQDYGSKKNQIAPKKNSEQGISIKQKFRLFNPFHLQGHFWPPSLINN